MQRPDDKLSELIAIGKGQGGWLTFSQVNDYLPDEAVNPEKLDMLLMSHRGTRDGDRRRSEAPL